VTPFGCWVFTRIYYEGGRLIIGDERSDTVGGQKLIGVDFDPQLGMTVHFTAYDAFVPTQWVKASWKR
jgi:hypothetical protein